MPRTRRDHRHDRKCSIEGCEKPHKGHGYCVMHLYRWKRYGDPLVRKNDYGAKRRVGNKGYIFLWAPEHPLAMSNGYVTEHRKVAWDAGLLTDPRLVVHHRNGDKTDNRIENLEVHSAVVHIRMHHNGGDVCKACGESNWRIRTDGRRRCRTCASAYARARYWAQTR